MAEKDYDIRIAEAKAALDSYSAEQEAIEKLYRQAKQNAEASYAAQKEQLEKQTAESKNQAAVDMMKTERNIGQTLASRGLAFSGENAQTHLDLTLGLRSRLAQIDSDSRTQAGELERDRTQKQTDLDLEYAQQRASGAEKKAEMQSELAGIAAERDAFLAEQNDSGEKTENESSAEEESTKIPFPDLKGKSIWERIKLVMKYAAQVQNAGGSDSAEQTGMTPGISARDLAKQLVASAGENGKVSGYSQQKELKLLLDAMTETHDLEEGYYNELLLNLQSMGYRPNYEEDIAVGTTSLQEEAANMFETYYKRYYELYRLSGYETADCDRLAGEQARFKQLLHLYNNSESIERFEAAARGMNLEGDLDGFYETVEQSPDSYVLGSGLRR